MLKHLLLLLLMTKDLCLAKLLLLLVAQITWPGLAQFGCSAPSYETDHHPHNHQRPESQCRSATQE